MTVLTKEHCKWIAELEAENKDLPMGYARAMVTWYLENPEIFTEAQIQKWRDTPVPKLEKTFGSAETYTGAEADAIYEKMIANCGKATLEPLTDKNNTQVVHE
jgi:hypothetical protein